MNNKISLQQLKQYLIAVVLLLPLIFYSWRASLRPTLSDQQQVLFSGITYQRKTHSLPRPLLVHIIAIDLKKTEIKPFVTPPQLNLTNRTNLAITTSNFIEKFNLQLAVNASFFYPFKEQTPWDYYPKTGETVNAIGESIANNIVYGNSKSKWNVLCFAKNNLVKILNQKQCPQKTVQGITGRDILVLNGKIKINYKTPPYARTVAATNKEGDRLWLIVVDGKQPFYSEGITLQELAEIAINLGADSALNLDGGGSTTLAISNGSDVQILNAPIHNKIPMNERPIANHLGFYALPDIPL